MTILVPISYTGRGDQVRPTQSSLEALTAARSIDTVHAIVVCEPGVSETLAEAIAPYGVDVLHAAEDKDAFTFFATPTVDLVSSIAIAEDAAGVLLPDSIMNLSLIHI